MKGTERGVGKYQVPFFEAADEFFKVLLPLQARLLTSQGSESSPSVFAGAAPEA